MLPDDDSAKSLILFFILTLSTSLYGWDKLTITKLLPIKDEITPWSFQLENFVPSYIIKV